ncbi:MAG: FMN-binding protein [Thermodesulfobacteriota bacterium]
MKDIIKITMSLTGVCIAAALILGAVYTQTERPRQAVEKMQNEEVIQGLLGYGHGKHAPSDLVVYRIDRYVVQDAKRQTLLGYVLPVKDGKFTLTLLDLEGKPVDKMPVTATAAELENKGTRNAAVKAALPKGSEAMYADTYYIADQGGKRLGYVLPGITQGFKTFIKLMVSLDSKFTVTGVAITESEEDPGLGAEIQQDYFRNQFKGKTQDQLAKLKVIKEPLPDEYFNVLDPKKTKKLGIKAEEIKKIKEKHLPDDIYALTGATISSRAVTRGVQDTVRKFAYRFDMLKKAVEKENIPVAF